MTYVSVNYYITIHDAVYLLELSPKLFIGGNFWQVELDGEGPSMRAFLYTGFLIFNFMSCVFILKINKSII